MSAQAKYLLKKTNEQNKQAANLIFKKKDILPPLKKVKTCFYFLTSSKEKVILTSLIS